MNNQVLDVRNLRVEFKGREGSVVAVNSISFQVQRGQTLGIVGESGSGKSVSALAAIALVPEPGTVTGGELWFSEPDVPPVNLLTLRPKELERYRGDRIAMIFQEPMTSLNPVYSVGFQLIEAIRQHRRSSENEAQDRAISLKKNSLFKISLGLCF